jgi:phosphatidyl-myo-inositol dimannoside synthase
MRTQFRDPGAPSVSPERVLLLTDRYVPDVGGSITWFHNVYPRYPAGTVWVLTRKYRGAEHVDALHPQVTTVRLRLERYRFLRPESLWLYAKMFLTSVALILRHRIRVVHAGKNLPEGLVAYLLHRCLGVPYVVYAHGEDVTVCSENPRLSRQQQLVFRNAAVVIVNSRYTGELIRALGVEPQRIAAISPGVEPARFTPSSVPIELRRRLGVEGKFVLLTVGRLQRRKGHDKVIEALPAMLRSVPDLVYLIAGDGEEMAALKELAEQKAVTHAVRFLGRVADEDLPALYNLSDVFIMANRTMPDGDLEGFGIVFLEASACEKPVIGGRSGGTADAVRDGVTGLLVDGTSVEQITQAVVTLARDATLRDTMGRQGRRLVVSEYDWEIITARTERVLTDRPAYGSSPISRAAGSA